MNHDMKLLSMLLRYSQRRMVVSFGLVQAHLLGDARAARQAVRRLEREGLVYVDGVTVRLTLPGFAFAVSGASRPLAAAETAPRAAQVRSRAA